MKKTKIKIKIGIILSLFFIIMCLNIYKQSPRYIIKDTVMWYEKDFTIPLFCKKVKFEYDDETVLSDYSNLINGKVPRCCIVIYKDKTGKYYFCIKRTDYSDWDGPDVW